MPRNPEYPSRISDYIPAGPPPERPSRVFDVIPGVSPPLPPTSPTEAVPVGDDAHARAPELVLPSEEAVPAWEGPAPPEATSSPERQPRVTLHGRIGAAPAFRTTPKGQLIARFPLAVHPTPDSTTWHTVLAFGARAQKLRDETSLHKGDQVVVIGYEHTREALSRTGTRQPVTEVYAVAVRTEHHGPSSPAASPSGSAGGPARGER